MFELILAQIILILQKWKGCRKLLPSNGRNLIVTIFSDLWGRLENDSGLTASNVAKYDGLHSMVVFKEHPPSLMDKVQYRVIYRERI